MSLTRLWHFQQLVLKNVYCRVSMEWPKIGTSWNLKNCGFSICTSSTTCSTCWDAFVATTTCFIMEIIGSTNTRCYQLLDLGWVQVFPQLPYIVVAWSSSPLPPPISSEQVRSLSSSNSLPSDPKVVLDFFCWWWGNKFRTQPIPWCRWLCMCLQSMRLTC
jgi:hypothetical protein